MSRSAREAAEKSLRDELGDPLVTIELETIALNQVFVRCDACNGESANEPEDVCECGGTGFDYSDTADVRATLRILPHMVEIYTQALEEIATYEEVDVNGEYTTTKPIDGYAAYCKARAALASRRET